MPTAVTLWTKSECTQFLPRLEPSIHTCKVPARSQSIKYPSLNRVGLSQESASYGDPRKLLEVGALHMKNSRSRGDSRDRAHESLYPDVLLRSQFHDSRCKGNWNESIRTLMVAVLQDAIRNFERNLHARTISRRRIFLNAERWFFSGEAKDELFSLETVCEILEVQPNRIRRAVSAWRNRALAGDAQLMLGNLMCHKTKRPLKPSRPRR